jgi:hypothetical protein
MEVLPVRKGSLATTKVIKYDVFDEMQVEYNENNSI